MWNVEKEDIVSDMVLCHNGKAKQLSHASVCDPNLIDSKVNYVGYLSQLLKLTIESQNRYFFHILSYIFST